MSFEEVIEKKKEIQNALLDYLEDESEAEMKYEIFVNNLEIEKIKEDRYKLESLLRMVNAISKNHHRNEYFNMKIDKILDHLRTDIQKYFTNPEIFDFFLLNKRALLFLIEEKILIIDEKIASRFTYHHHVVHKFCEYFFPEVKQFLEDDFIEKYVQKTEVVDDVFYKKRRIGENDTYLSEIIRKDNVVEFIIYSNKECLPLQSYIKGSIFETNGFLMDEFRKITLIGYAAFCGSIDIIKYLHINGVDLQPNIWQFAIRSENAELFRYLEENHVLPAENDFEKILKKSIKCHHNQFANYIIENLIQEKNDKYYRDIYQSSFKYRNYCFFPENIKHKNLFFNLCRFNYYTLVKLFFKQDNFDINAKIILN